MYERCLGIRGVHRLRDLAFNRALNDISVPPPGLPLGRDEEPVEHGASRIALAHERTECP
jgi:hypothetical protein